MRNFLIVVLEKWLLFERYKMEQTVFIRFELVIKSDPIKKYR